MFCEVAKSRHLLNCCYIFLQSFIGSAVVYFFTSPGQGQLGGKA